MFGILLSVYYDNGHVLTTVARRTPRDMFSIWCDPSLVRNNGKAAFSSVPRQQWEGCVFYEVCSEATMGRPRFLCGPFTGYIVQTSAGSELVTSSRVTRTVNYEYGTEFRRVTRIVMARDAIRVGCSGGCRVGSEVFRGREESQLL
jgi:hypothetical protein